MTWPSKAEADLSVVYDKVIFRRQRYGGISEYWRRLTGRVREMAGVNCKWETDLPFPLLRPNLTPRSIFHSSYYRYSVGAGTKTITTVHDFIHERGLVANIPQWRARLFAALKRRALSRSAVIVCASQATAEDLQELYPDLAGRIPVCVVHRGPTLDDAAGMDQAIPDCAWLDKPFFVFVGRRGAYKNFDLLLHALAAAKLQAAGVRLLVVGEPLSPVEAALVTKLGIDDVVKNVGSVTNASLRYLYQSALALIYPSAYEGFGLPVLDAMLLGCPVVAASTRAVIEVAGDAAQFFEPGDVEALSNAIGAVFSDERRQTLREKGRKRSNRFSWERAAEGYMSVYRLASNA